MIGFPLPGPVPMPTFGSDVDGPTVGQLTLYSIRFLTSPESGHSSCCSPFQYLVRDAVSARRFAGPTLTTSPVFDSQ